MTAEIAQAICDGRYAEAIQAISREAPVNEQLIGLLALARELRMIFSVLSSGGLR